MWTVLLHFAGAHLATTHHRPGLHEASGGIHLSNGRKRMRINGMVGEYFMDNIQWIGLRENLQETMVFTIK